MDNMKQDLTLKFCSNVNYMSAQMLATMPGTKPTESLGELSAADSMAQLEARAHQMAQV